MEHRQEIDEAVQFDDVSKILNLHTIKVQQGVVWPLQ